MGFGTPWQPRRQTTKNAARWGCALSMALQIIAALGRIDHSEID